MSRVFRTDQDTKVNVGFAAAQRVSMVISKSVFVFSETMAAQDAIELGRALIAAGEMASGQPLAAAAGKARQS